MLNSLNTVSTGAHLPQFVTCTLPDDVFNDNVAEFGKEATHWMDMFLKRLRRVCPTASGFWRKEWKVRQSGKYIGKLVPHIHLLVWGLPERSIGYADKWHDGCVVASEERFEAYVVCPDNQLTWAFVREVAAASEQVTEYKACVESFTRSGKFVFKGSRRYVDRCRVLLDAAEVSEMSPDHPAGERARNMSFQDWASLAWYYVVGSHNVDHLAAGVRIEPVKSWGGVMAYAAKYMSKADCAFLSDVAFGRSWGVFNRKCMPWAKLVEIDLDDDTGVRIRRIARHYLERCRGRRINAPYGLTVYCSVEQWRRLWEHPPPDPF
jgi:hypothetical protein